jgi:2-polyprenyl-3-methyl-5-hydroxy-6-metoxy-1,4-benzoquinol methylase
MLRPVGVNKAKATRTPWNIAEKFSLESIVDSYEKILDSDLLKEPVRKIMSYTKAMDPLPPSTIEQEERAWPGESRYSSTGYSRMMLGRYAFAGAHFCKGAAVLDICSGLGWGSYLVSHFARHVTAFDQDGPVVDQCRCLWPRENISWLTGDALDPAFLGGASFDTVLAMEVIEHFARLDGEAFVRSAAELTRPGGIFIGTSSFPETRQEANVIRQTNPFHLCILTRAEMLDLLQRYFGRAVVVGGWMFIAVKETSRG